MKLKYPNSRGVILILALWTMSLLAIFAAYIGLRVRQKVSLLSRIEERSQLRFLAESGVKKAIAMIKNEAKNSGGTMTAVGKSYLFNNLQEFSSVKMGQGEFSVYVDMNEKLLHAKTYGIADEERKINLNRAEFKTIQRLIKLVTNLTEEQSDDLAESIVNWRQLHSSELTGFASDNYYSNLKSSYEPKLAEFELFDELRLVKGFTKLIFDQLFPYITIYGDGLVNLNTASGVVLMALGLDAELVNKILVVREGADHQEATKDDYIFQKTFDIVSELKNFVEMLPFEIDQIEHLNKEKKLKTVSAFYRIESSAKYRRESKFTKVVCIYNQADQWIEYWHEK